MSFVVGEGRGGVKRGIPEGVSKEDLVPLVGECCCMSCVLLLGAEGIFVGRSSCISSHSYRVCDEWQGQKANTTALLTILLWAQPSV